MKENNKVLRRRIYAAAGIVLLAAIVLAMALGRQSGSGSAASVADAAGAQDAADGPKLVTDLPGSPIQLSKVNANKLAASGSGLELYVDETNGQVRIVDTNSGKQWLGAPVPYEGLSSSNVVFVNNPINISYTVGKEIVTTTPEKEKATIALEMIEQGARFYYNIASLGLKLAVEYRLTDNGFEAKVPFASIVEEGKARLTGVELLPFFEAAEPAEEGALFIPDGSGALMRFKEERLANFDFYTDYIYSGDHAFRTNVYETVAKIRIENIAKQPNEAIALPVFGSYKADQAYLGIVAEGAADARIRAYPAGIRAVELYRINVEFLYRNNDTVFVGNSGEIPMTEKGLIEGDRSIRYVLLKGEQSGYVGMAAAYRQYLIDEGRIEPLAEPQANVQLIMLGGAERYESIGKSFVEMTTFQQAKEIVEKYRANGIEGIEVHLEGWSKGGVLGDQPDHFPAAKSLGGSKGLAELSGFMRDNGVPLYLEANYVKPFADSKAVKPLRDAIRGLNKEVMEVNRPFVTTRQLSSELYYLLKPSLVFNKHIVMEMNDFAKTGASGVHFNYMGELIYSDHDKDPAFHRSATIGVWQQALDLAREKVGSASVDYGMAYTFGHIDRIQGVPTDSSNYTFMDETVPFYQLAIHGSIPYTAKPANLTDDPRIYKLKLLEFGAMPSYHIAYEPSSELKRTWIDSLFNSSYDYVLATDAAELSDIVKVLLPLSNQRMVNHEILQHKVNRTTYEDGTQVTVNYNPQAVTVGGHTVEAFGYSIAKGGEDR